MKYTTRMKLKFAGALLGVAASSLLVSGNALAQQNWPTRQITIIVGTAPGGTYDTIARLLASHFEKKWGQPAVVESRSGNILATSLVARAAPDGYTLVMGASNNAHLFIKELNFDPTKDLTPISVLGIQNYLLLVSRGAKVKGIADFMAQAKASPGKFNFGVVTGGPHDIETNDMQSALGIKVTHIGYKGIAPIYVALMANEIDGALGTTTPQLKTGEIIALAIAGEKRHPEYPDVPTFRESGIKYEPQANYPLWGRGGPPRPPRRRHRQAGYGSCRSGEVAGIRDSRHQGVQHRRRGPVPGGVGQVPERRRGAPEACCRARGYQAAVITAGCCGCSRPAIAPACFISGRVLVQVPVIRP
jgi:tripartite-type tricarboxylate transporter receptor subunit TctC